MIIEKNEKHLSENVPMGVENKNYALGRKSKMSWKYRLKRRTEEVIRNIHKHHPSMVVSVLDIGTAEGAMLSSIKKEFPQADCIGLEYSQELIGMNLDKNIQIIQGDAQNLPFTNNSFDVVVATAVIEHLSEPLRLLTEAYRVLRNDGILILTTPDPFFDRIIQIMGGEKGHQKTFKLNELKDSFNKTGFRILCAEKFMMSPIGFVAELKIEKLIKSLGLGVVLLNQIIVGKK